MTTAQFLNLVKNRAWWLVTGALIGTLLAAGVFALLPKTYESTAQVVVEVAAADNPTAATGTALQDRMPTVLELVRSSTDIHQAVAAKVTDLRTAQLNSHLTYSVPADTTVIDIAATGTSRQQAHDLSAAAATAVTSAINSGAAGMTGLQAAAGQQPTWPDAASAPDPLIVVPAGLLTGTLLALLLAMSATTWTKRARQLGDIAAAAQVPVVAALGLPPHGKRDAYIARRALPTTFPHVFSRLGLSAQPSPQTESSRARRQPPLLLGITTAEPDVDPTFVASGLAHTATVSGLRTVLVTEATAPTQAASPASAARTSAARTDAAARTTQLADAHHVLPPVHPGAVRTAQQLAHVLAELPDDLDLLVLNCGQAGVDPQARAGFELADHIIMVCSDTPYTDQLVVAAQAIADAGKSATGIIVVPAQLSHTEVAEFRARERSNR